MKHDLAKERPPRALLKRLISEENLDEAVSRRSPQYKARRLGERDLQVDEAVDLMLEEPNLMRRPLIVHGRNGFFGFDEKRLTEELGL